MLRRPSWPPFFVFLFAFTLSACGGCSNEPNPLTLVEDGGAPPLPLPPGPEGGPVADPCAPPKIDATSAPSFADAIRFLYDGPCPRQAGVERLFLDATRVSVIRGRVFDEAGAPLAGVRVRALRETRFGETKTDAEGRFDFVVNGAAPARLRFEATGKLLAQRTAAPKANRYLVLEDVTLLSPSGKSNPITFGGSEWQVSSGEVSKDESEPRNCIVLVPPGTGAETVKPDGTRALLTKGTLRITEFSRGKAGPSAMPGELPPASAYTYASAFSVDEAGPDVRVVFDKPVIGYVDNFLHMKVGAPVPAGALEDSDDGWKAEESGRVIAVVAGGIDANGDGQPDSADDLAKLAITQGELGTLTKAGLAPGKSYLRVPMTHFSSWDLNWAFGPPFDSVFPKDGSGGGLPDAPCFGSGGSWYECERRTLAEDIPLVGTSVFLHYHSDRVPGRTDARQIVVPVTGATVPPSVKRAEVSVTVLGVTEQKTFSSVPPNLSHTFTWSGKDAYGRDWPGETVAEVRVGLVYDGVYQNVRSFGAFGDGESVTGDKTRKEVVLNRRYEARIGARDQSQLGFGGWSLSAHHVYDHAGRVLYRGDGMRRTADGIGASVRVVAGVGRYGGAGDGGPALAAEFAIPDGIALDPTGIVYVSESIGHRVRKIDKGVVTLFAGTGTQGHTGDGGAATAATIDTPRSVTVLRDGRVCFAEQYADTVRCVAKDGVIRTVIGGGTKAIGPDPILATEATVSRPSALAEGPDGSLYVTMEGTGTIARLDLGGRVELAVGGGSDSGESVPARRVSLLLPRGLAVAQDGTMYIAEQGRNRIRRVDPSGIVSTFAGSGDSGNAGDGGPAESATFRGPTAVAVDPDGGVYVSDQGNLRIRRVDRGRVLAYAGGGDRTKLEGAAGRLFGMATRAMAAGPDSTLYVAEESKHQIATLRSPFPGTASGETILPDDSGAELYVFDARGRHLRTLESLTLASKLIFTYDGAGRLAKIEDRHQNALSVTRDGAGLATQITAPFGQVTTLGYDGASTNAYLTEVRDLIGRKESFSYSPGGSGLLTQRTDAGGGVHAMAYDPDGRLTRDANAENQRFAFSPGTVTSATEGGGRVDVQTGLGRREAHTFHAGAGLDEVRSLVDRDGTTTAWTTKKDGSTHAVWPDGTVLDVSREADPRLGLLAPYAARHVVRMPSGLTRAVDRTWTAETRPDGSLVSLSGERRTPDGLSTTLYDGVTRILTTTTPAGRIVKVALDDEGRVIRREYPGLPAISSTYDARDRLASVAMASRRTMFAYGPKGALAEIEDALSRKVSLERDEALRPTILVHEDAAKSAYAWSPMDDLLGLTPPGKPAHRMTYGKDGLEASYTAPGSPLESSAYDADRALTAISHEDASLTEVSYDSAGRPSRLSYAGGAVTFAYDAATGQVRDLAGPGASSLSFRFDGALLREVTASGAAPGIVSFTRDSMFRHSSETAGASTVAYGFDPDGLLLRAGSIFLTREPATGRLSNLSAGLAAEAFTYTPYGELATYQARSATGVLLDTSLAYDALSRLSEKQENGVAWAYTYDARGRLARVLRNGTQAFAYTYDANGNRSDSGMSADGQDRIAAKSGATYTYSPKGERLSKTAGALVTRYAYDGRGHLASAELPGAIRLDYDLDAYGRRITKRRNGSVENRFLYRNGLQPAAEVDAAGNVLTRYLYARGELAPDMLERGGSSYALLKDERGSIRFVVDAFTGVVAQALEYDPFGRVLSDTNPGFQPFGFAGGIYDSDTGLTHFGAREYDAETGSFTRKDPSGFVGGENRYAYAGGDPVNYLDSDGHFIVAVVAGALIGGAEGGIGAYVQEGVGQALDPDQAGWDCAAMRGAARSGAAAGAVAGAVGAGLKWQTPKSKPTFGHTFEKHGSGPKNAGRLSGTARGTGTPQGQWTDDGAAAQFLEQSRGGLSGPTLVHIPPGLGVVHSPAGDVVPASKAWLVPHPSGGYKSAYPTL